MLHGGTLAALILCYPRQWLRIVLSPFTREKAALKMLLLIVIATIPGAVAGVLLADFIESSLRSPRIVGIEFLINAVILLIAERAAQRRGKETMRVKDAALIGVAQAFALSPGLSRSTVTISAARALGFNRIDALDFSFIIAVPIIAGATLFACIDVFLGTTTLPALPVTALGVLASFLASIAAIVFLRGFVARHSLAWFALYLVPLGLLLWSLS